MSETAKDKQLIEEKSTMESKNKLSELISYLQTEMISKVNMSAGLNHPTDQGDNCEQSWIDWFNKYLPKRYRATKATVFDSKGNTSDQIDIVLYDEQYSYLAFSENSIFYIPAESVYAVFEVKQNSCKQNMEYAGQKAESVRKLYRTSAEIPHAGGKYPPKELHKILAGILTTRTDWSEPFGKPFRKCLESYTTDQQIDCGCVLEKGSFFYDYTRQSLKISNDNESLVFFFLQLLSLLQTIGTVPAIDLNEYMNALNIEEVNIDG